MNMLNIGFFGGTFDPIHIGHVLPIKKAAEQLALDKVHIIPSNIPPHKDNTQSNSFHRSEMVKIVCQHEPLFHFDGRELERKKLSYTVDSLRDISEEFRKKKQSVNLFFFMGMDSLNTFSSWYEWKEILSLCHLVVMPRPGYTLDSALDPILINQIIDCSKENNDLLHVSIDTNKHAKMKNVFIMRDMATDISSTQIRKSLALNKQKSRMKHDSAPQKWQEESNTTLTSPSLLHPEVYKYILFHQLY